MQSDLADPPTRKQRRRVRLAWTAAILALTIIIAVFVVRPRLFPASGDPGGTVMAQIVPAASALPGYGTSSLPWTSAPHLDAPYVMKMEPHRDSCDGMAGTEGWSQVVVQAGFSWSGSSSSLIFQVGAHMVKLGWNLVATLSTSQAQWSRSLSNGTRAVASLDLDPTGPPWWEFVVQGPPVGKAASGC